MRQRLTTGARRRMPLSAIVTRGFWLACASRSVKEEKGEGFEIVWSGKRTQRQQAQGLWSTQLLLVLTMIEKS